MHAMTANQLFRPARSVELQELQGLALARGEDIQAPRAGALGDWFTDIIDSFTGARAKRESETAALELARIRAAQVGSEAAAGVQWGKVLMPIGLAAVGVAGLVVILKLRKGGK